MAILRFLNIALVLSLLRPAFNAQCPERDKLVRKLHRWFLTDYFPDSQINLIADRLEPLINDFTTIETLKASAMSVVMSALNPSQYAKAAGLAFALMLKGVILTDVIDVGYYFAINNFTPFANQLMDAREQYLASGMSTDEMFAKCYILADQFLTEKRANTLWCRIKAACDRKNKKMYPAVASQAQGIAVLDAFDLSKCTV